MFTSALDGSSLVSGGGFGVASFCHMHSCRARCGQGGGGSMEGTSWTGTPGRDILLGYISIDGGFSGSFSINPYGGCSWGLAVIVFWWSFPMLRAPGYDWVSARLWMRWMASLGNGSLVNLWKTYFFGNKNLENKISLLDFSV